MPTQSFPHHLRGKAAVPVEAPKGVDVDWSSDRAAEVAAELGFSAVDFAGVQGSGKDGSITVSDVKARAEEG